MAEQLHILVTGTSRGIGESIVVALEGHRVVGHNNTGGDRRIAADLATQAGATALWHEAMAALDGRIDVLINNAGLFEAVPISSSDADWEAGWERTLRINLRSAADLCRRAVLHFRERQSGGRIVNVASRAAYRGD